VRITGGAWRSRRLQGPGSGFALRPTPDALRERAFAILGDRIVDRSFLDLYAGTGAVGLEALSRGADRVVFVEHHRAAARLIEANCAALGVSEDQAKVIPRPAMQVLLELARRGEVFGFAWADPPFDMWHEGVESREN
jgi:16S rRNA (guanine966-N2)-methyltransferase